MRRIVIAGSLVALSLFAFAQGALASATATLTISGSETQINGSWDTSEITISFNSFSETVSYGQFSTAASVASAFAAMFSRDYIADGLCAHASGAVITFYLQTGSFGPISVTGATSSFTVNTSGWTGGSGPPAPPAAPSMSGCTVTRLTIDRDTEDLIHHSDARKEEL